MATVFSPYTQFLAIVAGLVVGGIAATVFFTTTRASLAGSVTAAVALLVCVLVLPTLWRGAAGLDDARAGLRSPVPFARHDKCFYDTGRALQLLSVNWLAARIPPRDSFALDSRSVDRACFQLVMLPRRLVSKADRPDWTVVIGKLSPAQRRRHPAVLPPDTALIRER
jgi:hypothetical protein